MNLEVLLYILAGVGVVALAYFFGGKKYAIAAAVSALAALYLIFGQSKSWQDAKEEADESLKEEGKELDEEKEQKEREKEQTEEGIEDSKEREQDIRDDLDDVEEDVEKPDDNAEDLKDWVEGFGDKNQ